MKHVLIIGNGLGQLAKQITEHIAYKDAVEDLNESANEAEEMRPFVKQVETIANECINHTGESMTTVLNKITEAFSDCSNIPDMLIRKGKDTALFVDVQSSIINFANTDGADYTDAEKKKLKAITDNLHYLSAVCMGLSTAVKRTAEEMKKVVESKKIYEQRRKEKTPVITHDEKLDALIEIKTQSITVLEDQNSVIKAYIHRLKDIARGIECSRNEWVLKVLELKDRIKQLEKMTEEIDLAKAAAIESKHKLLILKERRVAKRNSELLSKLNTAKQDAGDKKCDCGGKCGEKCECGTEDYKRSACDAISEVNEIIKKLRELNSEAVRDEEKKPIEVVINEVGEKAKQLKEKAVDKVSVLEDAISKAKEALEEAKKNEEQKKDEAAQKGEKSAAADLFNTLFSNYFGCAFGEAPMPAAENPPNSSARNKAEKELDYYLGEALTMLDNGDLKAVEAAILSIKPALRKYSVLFSEEQQDADDKKAENSKSRFGVVVSYSFDDTIRVMTAETYEEAYEYMQKDFYNEKRIDVEENGYEIGPETEIAPTKAVLATIYKSSEVGYTYWNLVPLNDIKTSK